MFAGHVAAAYVPAHRLESGSKAVTKNKAQKKGSRTGRSTPIK